MLEKPSPTSEKITLKMIALEAATKQVNRPLRHAPRNYQSQPLFDCSWQAFCEVPSYDKLVECLLSGANPEELSKVGMICWQTFLYSTYHLGRYSMIRNWIVKSTLDCIIEIE